MDSRWSKIEVGKGKPPIELAKDDDVTFVQGLEYIYTCWHYNKALYDTEIHRPVQLGPRFSLGFVSPSPI